MTGWEAYAVDIVDRMSRKRKFGSVHTVEEANLIKGIRINNRGDKKSFQEALRYLINQGIVLFKSKDYARCDRAYYLNSSRSAEIRRILESQRLFVD
ncbi:hypothetical protein HYS54_00380 [Candidatus Micrarchaeota archaeon]|nr:hypothetical protein [Candidatus Micrarchaeota archaeon]